MHPFVLTVFRRALIASRCRVLVAPSRARGIHSDSSSLYVHWPYCEKRCTYCNFNKYISRNVDHDLMSECLVRELTTVFRSSNISTITTVFFGGGTPSLMRPGDVERFLQAVSRLTAAPIQEVTLECNPSPSARDSLRDFKEAGVTRLSIGVQSLGSNAELSSLGRTHTVEDSMECLDRAMHLFPGQVSAGCPIRTTGANTRRLAARSTTGTSALSKVLKLGTAHVSLYELTLERGTQLFKEVQAGLQSLPSSETCSQMYLAAVEALELEGVLRYEVSNFARKGHECRHNQACWRGLQYLGIGPGAHSRVLVAEGQWEARVQTLEPNPWMHEVSTRGHGTRLTRSLSRQDRLEELLMMGLRTACGISDQDWRAVSGGVGLVDTFDFVRTATYTDAQTGKVIEVPLERVRLKETAVPSVFANCPKYMSRPTPSAREAPEEKKVRLEAASLRAAIELSVAAQEEENRKNKVGSFEEFCRALSNFSVSDFWSLIIKESKVVFLDLALQRAPAVRSSVAVSVDLCIDVFIGEARIENLPSVNVTSHLQDLRQLNEVLQSVEQLHVSHSSDDNQKAHRLLKIVLMLLEDVCSEYQLQEFHGWHLEVLKFVSSQVELILKNSSRYSPEMLVFAGLLFTISPHAYNFIRSSMKVKLPHPVTIRRLCSSCQVSPALEQSDSCFLNYAKSILNAMKEHERTVTLMMD
ncbi:hypothetical protein MTO96_026640 [Rhipicephalus appendiculatus]